MMLRFVLIIIVLLVVLPSDVVSQSASITLPRVGTQCSSTQRLYFGLFPRVEEPVSLELRESGPDSVQWIVHRVGRTDSVVKAARRLVHELEYYLVNYEQLENDSLFRRTELLKYVQPLQFRARGCIVEIQTLQGQQVRGELLFVNDTFAVVMKKTERWNWMTPSSDIAVIRYDQVSSFHQPQFPYATVSMSAAIATGAILPLWSHELPLAHEDFVLNASYAAGAAFVGAIIAYELQNTKRIPMYGWYGLFAGRIASLQADTFFGESPSQEVLDLIESTRASLGSTYEARVPTTGTYRKWQLRMTIPNVAFDAPPVNSLTSTEWGNSHAVTHEASDMKYHQLLGVDVLMQLQSRIAVGAGFSSFAYGTSDTLFRQINDMVLSQYRANVDFLLLGAPEMNPRLEEQTRPIQYAANTDRDIKLEVHIGLAPQLFSLHRAASTWHFVDGYEKLDTNIALSAINEVAYGLRCTETVELFLNPMISVGVEFAETLQSQITVVDQSTILNRFGRKYGFSFDNFTTATFLPSAAVRFALHW